MARKKTGDALIVDAVLPWGLPASGPGRGGETFTIGGTGEFRLIAHPAEPTKIRAVPTDFVVMGHTRDEEIKFSIQIQIDAEDPDTPEWQTGVVDVRFNDPRGSLVEAIRLLDLDEVVRIAVEKASREYDAPPGLAVGPLRGRRRARSMASQLEVAVEAYRAGGVQGVADKLVVSERQARNYVRKAREAGLLGPEEYV